MTITTTELAGRACIAPSPGNAGYTIHGCRCATCTSAHTDYQNRRTRLIAYGQWQPLVDAQPVREHLERLSTAGIGSRQVSILTGVGITTIRSLRGSGTANARRSIRPETADAILAVRATPETLAGGSIVDPTGTCRRIQALVAIGWSISAQARRLRCDAKNYHSILTKPSITAATARQVADLYEQMSGTPAPDGLSRKQAIAHARRRGYLPPLAWGDDIDNPAAVPHLGEPVDDIVDDVAIRRVLDGRLPFDALRPAERLALFRDHADGMSLNKLMSVLRMSASTVGRWRSNAAGRGQVAA
jgi:hypothetical protein